MGPGHAFFRRRCDTGLVTEFPDRPRAKVREGPGRDAGPSGGVFDSQSVQADAVGGVGSRGLDGGKLISGRERHVVVAPSARC